MCVSINLFICKKKKKCLIKLYHISDCILLFVFVRYRWIETVGDDDIILPGAKLIDGLTGRSDIRVIHLDHGDASGHNRALKNSEYQKRYVFIQEGLKFNSGEESERKKTN